MKYWTASVVASGPAGKEELRILSMYGEPAGGRTQDPRLKRAMLYQLSYRLLLPIDFSTSYALF